MSTVLIPPNLVDRLNNVVKALTVQASALSSILTILGRIETRQRLMQQDIEQLRAEQWNGST